MVSLIFIHWIALNPAFEQPEPVLTIIYTDKEKQSNNISKRTKMTGETRMIRIITITIGMAWVTGMTRMIEETHMTRIDKITIGWDDMGNWDEWDL